MKALEFDELLKRERVRDDFSCLRVDTSLGGFCTHLINFEEILFVVSFSVLIVQVAKFVEDNETE
ncbi:hypothetical protein WT14_16785 [Burkholderia stagnalis]|nr:hypothetical protein WT14_16785 [Burkholderia stagnalis]